MRYPVAAVQFEPRFADKERNVGELISLTRQAARAGARLVVLPEMATTGYCFRSRTEIAPLVEPVPGGPTVAAFAAVAAAESIYIVAGIPEVEPATGAFYNTAFLVGPKGYVGKYRKTHSYIDETRWARDGDLGVPVFATELGRIAINICMDASFFEPARLAAVAGADLIAFPTNWLGQQAAWRARARENGVYVVCANRYGEERGAKFCGNTAVIDPQGAALNLLSAGDGVVMAEVDLDLAAAARAMALALRRPEAYQELLISRYLWHWKDAQRLPEGRPVVVGAGDALDPHAMADQLRWADKLARDRGWPSLDLAVFPQCPGAFDPAPLLETAAALNCHVVWGAPDVQGRPGVWLAGPTGLVGRYRPIHQNGETGAGEWAVFDLPWGRLGLLAGAELALPEPARILALQGADMIAAPADWTMDEPDGPLWLERSLGNNTALAVANAAGGSRIIQPVRPCVTESTSRGEMAMALVDTGAEAIRAKELLRKLQPRWYESLVTPKR
jgi:predicted amidohydrolase